MHYHITKNVPGYMPEQDPITVRSMEEARAAVKGEVEFDQHVMEDEPGFVEWEIDPDGLFAIGFDHDNPHHLGWVIEAAGCQCEEGEEQLTSRYVIREWGAGWALFHEDSSLQIGYWGGVAPTAWDALSEAQSRAADDDKAGYRTSIEVEADIATFLGREEVARQDR